MPQGGGAPHMALTNPKAFAAYLAPLHNKDWVVYAKRPFGGPEQVLRYLARYAHRVAISNRRLISADDKGVTFTWKDYRRDGAERYNRVMTLDTSEFHPPLPDACLAIGLPPHPLLRLPHPSNPRQEYRAYP